MAREREDPVWGCNYIPDVGGVGFRPDVGGSELAPEPEVEVLVSPVEDPIKGGGRGEGVRGGHYEGDGARRG